MPQDTERVSGMTRRDFLKTAGSVAASLFLGPGLGCAQDEEGGGQRASRPNVCFIISDQHRWDVTGYSGNPHAHTPNLDRLARESVNFSNMYCQYPVCVPSRQSLITGRYPHGHGTFVNNTNFPAGQETIVKQLRRHGYYTAMIGKSHFNDSDFEHVDAMRDKKLPGLRRGKSRFPGKLRDYNPDMLSTNGEEEYHLEETVVRHFEELLRKGLRKPFFTWISLKDPHPPLVPPREHMQAFSSKALPIYESLPKEKLAALTECYRERHAAMRIGGLSSADILGMTRAYYASVAYMDSCVGRVLDLLRKHRLEDDTIVVYTSDHGEMLNQHGLFAKQTFYEGAAHIPCLLRTPGSARAGKPVARITQHIDLIATLFDLVGVPTPSYVQGRSMTPLLANPDDRSWEDVAYCEMRAVEGPSRNLGRTQIRRMTRTEQYKYCFHPDGKHELYDVREDPGEARNLVDDAKYAKVAGELRGQMLSVLPQEFYVVSRKGKRTRRDYDD